MALFSDVLLTVDFDRTLTAPDNTIPQRNLDAIRFFMEEGGAFTVNTGRSLPMARLFMDRVPVNAPLLLYNGAAAYDVNTGTFPILHPIALEQSETLRRFMELCPQGVVEVQGVDAHYTFSHNEDWEAIYRAMGCAYGYSTPDGDMGPFLKASVCCPDRNVVKALFVGTPEHNRLFDGYERTLRERFPQLSVCRSTPVILDIQTAGVNKGLAARELVQSMGRRILVCVGDERNDLTMLDMADYAFCPADALLAPCYENVCSCSEGAVADVILKKIPEILGFSLDKQSNVC